MHKEKAFLLVLLVIAAIFIICAVHFNSFRYPAAIIWLIPVSFIGVFLLFPLAELNFDRGGFASMIMLCGLTVNAGIYIVSALLSDGSYLKAFRRKIWPVTLTILSTILGLIPFLFDGPKETFWFPFAAGTIAGLIFSMIAILVYLPIFCLEKSTSRESPRGRL